MRLDELGRRRASPNDAEYAAAVVGAAHFGGLLERYGVVANGTTDDSSALQEAILAARAAGYAQVLPMEVQTIKLNSGITLLADKDRLVGSRPVTLDCSGITTGHAINVDCSITDGNVAPFDNIRNFLHGMRLKGAGSPSVAGASGVAAFRFYSASGKPYFYQVKNCSADGFAITADLYSNTFGIAFEDVAFRAAQGGTLIQCLKGGGADYGERYNFTRAMLYNSALALLNTNAATTFRFLNSSFDYNDVMADIRAGRVSLESCHIETNKDTDYMFKLSGNEAAALTIAKSELVLNAVNRTKEIFDTDSNVKFGGIFVRDTMVSHGAGYSAATYVRGDGPAVAQSLMRFESQVKVPFSKYMNKVLPGMDSANAISEWTVTGAGGVTRDTTDKQAGASSMRFNANSAATTAAIIRSIEPGQHPAMSYYYRKQGSTTGQALLQVRLDWLDSKGTTISTVVLEDLDGNVDWTLRRSSINARPPIGAASYQLRFIKSADTGGTGQVWIDEFVINNI